MPAGAFVGAGVVFGIVGAKGEVPAAGATSAAAATDEIQPALKTDMPSKEKMVAFSFIKSFGGEFAGRRLMRRPAWFTIEP